MRSRIFFLAVAATSLAAGLGVQACSSDATVEPTDAGTTDAKAERTPTPDPPDTGTPDTGPGCDTNADFTDGIPDASIADGASTSGICVSCAKAQCKSTLDQCNKLCECQGAAGKALDCFFKNPSIAACAGSFAGVSSQTQGIGVNLFSCINTNCRVECAVDALLPDGGDAGDAALD